MKTRFHILALLIGLSAATVSRAADPAPSWDLDPYRISVLIAVDTGASLPHMLADDLLADLPARAAAAVGGSWKLVAAAAPVELRRAMLTALADVPADRLPASSLSGDKVILLAIGENDAGYHVAARELDLATRTWNSVVVRQAAYESQIPSAAVEALVTAFAPVGRIDSVQSGVATLRMRAGSLVRRDSSSAAVATGTVFRPVLVGSDAAGRFQAQSAQPVDWTLLTATTASGAAVTCRIDTGLAGEAIPAFHPARARLAIGVTAPQASTRLKLVADVPDRPPLEGYEVLVESADPARSSGPSLGISDSDGIVTVPPGSGAARILLVRQGSQTLARVPIVPGLSPEVVLPLADDRQRLAIDTSLLEVQDGLIDLAARRQALAARIKLARKSRDNSAADKLIAKLRGLSGVESLTAQLDQIDRTLKTADARTQSLLQPKLDALRKLAKDLAAQSPTSLLDEPKSSAPNSGEAKKSP